MDLGRMLGRFCAPHRLLLHALLLAERPEAAGLSCARRLQAQGSIDGAPWGGLVAELCTEEPGPDPCRDPGPNPDADTAQDAEPNPNPNAGRNTRLVMLPVLLWLPASLQRSVVSLLGAVQDELPAPARALLRRALTHPAASRDPWVCVAARALAPPGQRGDDGASAVSEARRGRYAALRDRLRARSLCVAGRHRSEPWDPRPPVAVLPERAHDSDELAVRLTSDPGSGRHALPRGLKRAALSDDDGETGGSNVAAKRPRRESPRQAGDLSPSHLAPEGGDPGTPVPGPRELSDGGGRGGGGGGGGDVFQELLALFPQVEPEQDLPPHIKDKVARVKEWLEAACEFPGTEETGPPELSVLNECRPEQVSAVCAALGAATLPEASVALLATAVAALSPKIGHAACSQLARDVFLPKLSSLEQPASRLLSGALGSLCSSYPKQCCAGCLLPLTQASELGPFQVELMCRVIRDNLASDDLPSLLKLLVSSPGVCWGEGLVTVLQAILERKMELTVEEVELMVTAMSEQAPTFSKSLKFAKLLLALVNKHGAQVTRGRSATLAAIVEVGDTFMKRTLRATLKKVAG